MRTHIINYAKTKDIYVAYRKAGYSKKFFEAHREEITLHKAAKEAFSNLPDKKIPRVKELNAEYAEVLEKKKSAYAEYRQAKKEMQDYVTAKHNIDAFYRRTAREFAKISVKCAFYKAFKKWRKRMTGENEKEMQTEEDVNYEGPAVYRSREVMEFKARTEEHFRPIGGLSATEIEEMVEEYVNTKLRENDFDAEVVDVVISGSRCRGLEGKHSDLDVVVEYAGDEREDDMFNLLHEDKFSIGGVKVDINPITECRTGTLEEYLPGVEKYLEEKSRKVSVKEKLAEKKSEVQARDEKSGSEVKKKIENVR